MYKKINFTEPGGLFVYQDSLEYLQSAYSDAIDAIAAMYGNMVIVAGLVITGGSITDGWVVYNGELIPVTGGSLLAYLHLNAPVDPEQYADGSTQNIYTHKSFVFSSTSGGNVAWSGFKRLAYNSSTIYDAFNNIKSLLQKAINLEPAVILSGCVLSSVTGTTSGTATISAGAVLMDGEIVSAPLRTAGAWPCWLKPDGTYVTSDPGGTNVKFDYETSQRYRHVLKRQTNETGEIVMSKSASDLALFDAATGLGKWKWLGWKLCYDMRSRVGVGYDNRTSTPGGDDAEAWDIGNNTLANFGGEKEHQLTPTEMPSHTHGLPNQWNEGGGGHIASGGNTDEGTISDRTGSAGGDDAHENRQPYRVILFIERL